MTQESQQRQVHFDLKLRELFTVIREKQASSKSHCKYVIQNESAQRS